MSDDVIRRAAEVIADYTDIDAELEAGYVVPCHVNPAALARALDEAGLLAPAPFTEEFDDEQVLTWGGKPVACRQRRRWVTEWEETYVDGPYDMSGRPRRD